ncbi:MAG TPA: hypothetical protein VFX43_19885 [Chitinophagaceae bacterium]|nr:hypothetical protein [Chitinophagaceae bacterium]
MDLQFENLTDVLFKHDYFSNGKFGGLRVEIPDNCIYMMRNHGLLFKPAGGGFSILYDAAFAGGKRKREQVLEDPLTLHFNLQLDFPSFYNYTANLSGLTSGAISESVFYFSNVSREAAVTLPAGKLHQEDTVSGKDLYPAEAFPGRFFGKPFGLLDLQINREMKQTYAIHFSARATFWRYILVGEHLLELHQPAVLDPGGKQVFEGPGELVLPDGRKALAFTSTGEIGLRETVPLPFQLVEHYEPATGKYKMVIGALPFPDVNIISHAGRLTGKDVTGEGATGEDVKRENKTLTNFSEIFIY